MATYTIKRLTKKDFIGIEKANIDNILWGGTYRPECFAQVIYVEGDGFYAKMSCKEAEPRMTYKKGEFSDDVCDDSCMEWFIDFMPGNEKGYINFEGTAAAAMNCGVGTNRDDRIPIDEMTGELPGIEAGRDGEFWWTEYFLSLDIIKKVFGEIDLSSGAEYRGNFYKCGELTSEPSYLSWTFIDIPDPDYHRPDFFGKFIME